MLHETATSAGVNLVKGYANWWRDALAVGAGGKPRGVEEFRPGVGVALTPGKVVHRNALVELLMYAPSTRTVAKEPVLVVPSWIMKYYILDLTPEDSLVKFLVDRGHTVFMVSWRNPGAADRQLSLDDYLECGVLDAIRAVQASCPGAGVHAAGYCLGGTLLAMGAAVLGGRKDTSLKTVSILAGQVDFEEPGELGLFMEESQVAFLEDLMAERGYRFGGQHVTLRAIHPPLFVVATERDHVSPWTSVYKILRLVHTRARFVLVSGGHNVGIVSPPAGPSAHPQAGYRWADHEPHEAPADPQAWREHAAQAQGSWWTCWDAWLREHGTAEVPARAVPDVPFEGRVVPAPGTHVFQE